MNKAPVDFLMPPVQPSFGEVLMLGDSGQLYRLIIPVPGYAMGNMERLGVDLNRDDNFPWIIEPEKLLLFTMRCNKIWLQNIRFYRKDNGLRGNVSTGGD
ncbi:hypothetical protein A2W24_00040 [Microgenomates group bacterium RBG_16_45_19]|nr:MAG: hypothetical protein A2W24_00040 [Microgenomates group bacterium RBG_16_45_19]